MDTITLSQYMPGQALRTPGGSEFLDNRHVKVVRLSALSNCRLHPPGDIQGTHFCKRLNPYHMAAGRIKSMKNANDTIGNQTHNLSESSIVSQQTAPPRTPLSTGEEIILGETHGNKRKCIMWSKICAFHGNRNPFLGSPTRSRSRRRLNFRGLDLILIFFLHVPSCHMVAPCAHLARTAATPHPLGCE
jgi:hypothetical protein